MFFFSPSCGTAWIISSQAKRSRCYQASKRLAQFNRPYPTCRATTQRKPQPGTVSGNEAVALKRLITTHAARCGGSSSHHRAVAGLTPGLHPDRGAHRWGVHCAAHQVNKAAGYNVFILSAGAANSIGERKTKKKKKKSSQMLCASATFRDEKTQR